MTRVDFDIAWSDRFWANVAKGRPDECWLWAGTLNNLNRPSFGVGGRANQRRVSASRFSYWLANGDIKPGLVVCHTCDDPRCVNPDHLFTGTQADNLADMTNKGRRSHFALSGESAPGCKISDELARAIVARWRAGESPSTLAAEINVNRATIYKLAKRVAR